MDREEETRLKAILDKIEGVTEKYEAKYKEKYYSILLEKAKREAEEARIEAEEARIEAERARQEALRTHEETEIELAWWDSVKRLPPEERLREIRRYYGEVIRDIESRHGRSIGLQSLEDTFKLFPLGEA